MSGEAAVILDTPEIAAFQGAERLWTFFKSAPHDTALRWAAQEDGARHRPH